MGAKNRLTAKQEKFAVLLAQGLTQRQAYKGAYSWENKTNESIDQLASRLFANVKVMARYRELMAEHKEKALWTREMAVNDLVWIKEKAKSEIESLGIYKATADAFLGAVYELNKVEDVYNDKNDKELAIKLERMELDNDIKREQLRKLQNDGDGSESEVVIIDDL